MALDDPVGPISKIAALLESMLQATHVWSSLGATVYHHHLPPPANQQAHTKAELQALRPFVLLWTNDQDGIRWTKDTAGADACSGSDGEIVIRIERNTPAGTPAEVARNFENLIGSLCKGSNSQPGLMDLAGDTAYLPIQELRLIEHARTRPEQWTEIGDAQRAYLLVTWRTGR